MSKEARKIRRATTKAVERVTKKDFVDMLELVCQMSIRARLKIAWLIIRGRGEQALPS